MRGVIDQAKPSQSGKSLSVYLGGNWYTTKHFGLIDKVGQEIVFDPKDVTMKDGMVIKTIPAYTLASEPAPTPAAAPTPTPLRPQVQASPPNPYQPLVSNLAAHLIAAGKPVTELPQWYEVCVFLLEDGKKGKGPPKNSEDDPDDPIPF